MLQCETSHRILRRETAWDLIKRVVKNNNPNGDIKRLLIQELVGNSVLTRYNNATYQIDDIDTTNNPLSR